MDVKTILNTHIVNFFELLRKKSLVSIKLLCSESHVSTRTYAKLKKNIPVKTECYHRLFIALIRISVSEDFCEEWQHFGTNLQHLYYE